MLFLVTVTGQREKEKELPSSSLKPETVIIQKSHHLLSIWQNPLPGLTPLKLWHCYLTFSQFRTPLVSFFTSLKVIFSDVFRIWRRPVRIIHLVCTQNFLKINICYLLIRRRMCTYHVVRNISLSEIFAFVLNEWSPTVKRFNYKHFWMISLISPKVQQNLKKVKGLIWSS